MTVTSLKKAFPPDVELYFPFDPRPGQRLMANEIYYGILENNQVAIEGAAGMGKTVTCLSSLLPICKSQGYRLLYAARTHTQIQRVIEELRTIYKLKGHDLTGISLYGRANMCLQEEIQEARPLEAMELCNDLRRTHKCEWFENLKSKELDGVSGCFDSEYIRDFGMQAGVCPYYLSKDLLRHCGVIALTYIYLINPFMRSIFLRSIETPLEKCILVFDECHNLPQLAMQTMSTGESLYGVERATKEYNHYDPIGDYSVIGKFLKHFKDYLTALREEYEEPKEEMEVPVDPPTVVEFFQQFVKQSEGNGLFLLAKEMQEFGRRVKRQKMKEKQHPSSSVYHFGTFLEHLVSTFKEPQYLHYIIVSKHRIQYYIRCIDCRNLLKPLQKARGIVSMSGTLEPIDAYLSICGFAPNSRRKVLPTPFNHEKVAVFCSQDIDFTFYNRTEAQYLLLADRCLEVIRGTPGNTAIFCASYDVLEGLLKTPLKNGVKKLRRPFYREMRERSSKDNDVMITQFKTDGLDNKKAVLAGVCGGRNSEGVDFPGSEMLTVVVLGIPLARMTHSINALITYYTQEFGVWNGKDYAYTLPAMRRANQAAGRPIRSLHDYGVIVLLDSRYKWGHYRKFLSHWINENMVILDGEKGELERAVTLFYQNQLHDSYKTIRRMI